MRMNRFAIIVAVALAGGAQAQTFISPSRALRPLTNPKNQPGQTAAPYYPASPPTQYSVQSLPAKPTEIVARIDAGLAASKINLLGRVDGLKGSLYVTNVGQQAVSPSLRFAVCDRNAAQIGTAVKTGGQLMPNGFEKIEVLATNLGAADLKLMRLSAKE
jgi:hypothetical protein